MGLALTDAQLRDRAERIVRNVLDSLPVPLQEQCDLIAIRCLSEVPQALQDEGIGESTLGLFSGYVHHHRADGPAVISLFLQPIWRYAHMDPVRFDREVRNTLLHEIGHYLGLEEDDLERRGL